MRKLKFFTIVSLMALLTACGEQSANTATETSGSDTTLAAGVILKEAYLYALPMVLMDITKRQMTGNPSSPMYAPVNQFRHNSFFPDASFRNVVRPNADTYYSIAWLDLANEPLVLSLPDTKDRYYMMPMMDAFSNVFASPGTRTTGNKAGNFLVTGPQWSGTVPADMQQIKAPTNTVWIIGRTQVNSREDGIRNVAPLQKKYTLTPLSGWGKPPTVTLPAVADTTVPMGDPNAIVRNMPVDEYFNYANKLLVKNAPLPADQPAIDRFAQISIGAGKNFDLKPFPADIQQRANGVSQLVFSELNAALTDVKDLKNGWNVGMKVIGTYGTDYASRALVGYFGLGANLKEDAIYPSASLDADGKQLNGVNKYVIHFEKGQTPPAKAFWSLTMYDPEGYFTENSLKRYTIGDRSNLKQNADGSVDIYFQHENPGKERQSNWLPAPKGDFNVLLRVYWPKEEMVNGSWIPPAIRKIE